MKPSSTPASKIYLNTVTVHCHGTTDIQTHSTYQPGSSWFFKRPLIYQLFPLSMSKTYKGSGVLFFYCFVAFCKYLGSELTSVHARIQPIKTGMAEEHFISFFGQTSLYRPGTLRGLNSKLVLRFLDLVRCDFSVMICRFDFYCFYLVSVLSFFDRKKIINHKP